MAGILKILGVLLIAMTSMGGEAAAGDPENTLYMETEHGRVVIDPLPSTGSEELCHCSDSLGSAAGSSVVEFSSAVEFSSI